jgi:hypothetical protein
MTRFPIAAERGDRNDVTSPLPVRQSLKVGCRRITAGPPHDEFPALGPLIYQRLAAQSPHHRSPPRRTWTIAATPGVPSSPFTNRRFTDPEEVPEMFPHPEDLHRAHQLQHAEMIRNHTLERQARAAHRPTHRLREIGLHVSGFVRSSRWWKGVTALFTRHSHQAGTGTTALRDGALPTITPGFLSAHPRGR